MSARDLDEAVERMVAQRLDAWYAKMGFETERVTDRQRQVRGVDLVFRHGGRSLNFDEKAKWRRLQDEQPLRNYSFEVSRTCRDGTRRAGWFADPDVLTDYYCWAFPLLVDPQRPEKGIRPDMRVELFAKKDVLALVEEEIPQGRLATLAEGMFVENRYLLKFRRFVLYKTPRARLAEEPVNVLIKRDVVAATRHFREFTA